MSRIVDYPTSVLVPDASHESVGHTIPSKDDGAESKFPFGLDGRHEFGL